MKRIVTVLCALALALSVTLSANDQAREQKLQQAIDLIESKGDLAKAAPLLEDVAKSADRALAARGLLYLAQAQERFGHADAVATYQRIINEFGGPADAMATTAEVVVARARLAAIAQKSAEPVARQVADGVGGNAVSPDGRYLAFVDDGANVAVHDLAASQDVRLTNDGKWNDRFAERPVPSPDSRSIAYGWRTSGQPATLRVIGRDGGPPRVVYSDKEKADFIFPCGWSSDGKWILAELGKSSTSGNYPRDLVLIPVASGATRFIMRVERGAAHFRLSPDGRWVAYDRPGAPGKSARDVFVVSVDTGKDIAIRPHEADDYMLGWFPEPKSERILFGSDRGTTYGIWATRVVEGRAQGEPTLIRPGTGVVQSQDFTRKGDFYYRQSVVQNQVSVGALNRTVDDGSVRLTPLEGRFTDGMMQAVWSPDSARVAYLQAATPPAVLRNPITQVNPNLNLKLMVQTIATGEVRPLSPLLRIMQNPVWLPNGSGVIVQGTDMGGTHVEQGRQGLFLIDLATGALTTIADRDAPSKAPNRSLPAVSPDSRRIFFKQTAQTQTAQGQGEIGTLIVRDMTSGAEQALMQEAIQSFALSPDGERLAVLGSSLSELVVISSVTGEARLPVTAVRGWNIEPTATWSHDSRSIFVVRMDAEYRNGEIWEIPVDGAAPRSTGIRPPGRTFRLSASLDGNRLAVSTRRTSPETWVLQNLSTQREK